MAHGDNSLTVSIKSVLTQDDAKTTFEEIKKQLEKMSAAMLRSTFTGATTGKSMTGLRAALGANAWKFGTVHRNKMTSERVMAVGYRQVTGLTHDRSEPYGHVSDTVEDWFDYWEVEFEEVT